MAAGPELESLLDEARQLRAIFKASYDTARHNDQAREKVGSKPKILRS